MLRKSILPMVGLCLMLAGCQAGEVPIRPSVVYVGLRSFPVPADGKLDCQQLLPQNGGTRLAWAADGDGRFIAARLLNAGDGGCDFSAKRTAEALIGVEVGALAGSADLRAAALNAVRSSDLSPMAAQLRDGMSLDVSLRNPGLSLAWKSSLSTLHAAALVRCDVSGGSLPFKADPLGDDGVGFSARVQGGQVTLTAHDCGSFDVVKGILVNGRAPATYLLPKSDSLLVSWLESKRWNQDSATLTLNTSATPTTVSVVAPATVTGILRGILDTSRSNDEVIAQGNATMYSFEHIALTLFNDMFIDSAIGGLLDQIATNNCELALTGMLNAVHASLDSSNELKARLSAWDIVKSIADFLLHKEDGSAPGSVRFECLRNLPAFKIQTVAEYSAMLSRFVNVADAVVSLKDAAAATWDLATGYPYLRHTLLTCSSCSSAPCTSDAQCSTGYSCVVGTCIPRSCAPGTRLCAGTVVQQCNSNGTAWQTVQACGTSCQAGACCGGVNDPCCTGQSSSCGAGLLCANNGRCIVDSTPTRLTERFTSTCSPYAHWTSTNNICYPGSSLPTQGCGACGATVVNGMCTATMQTCWIREDDQSFRTADADPGYGRFSRLNHCFEGGVNSYTRGTCTTAGDPTDLGFIADAPVGRYTVPVSICLRSAGAAAEQFLSVKVQAECINRGLAVLAPNPFGYVALP